MILKTLKNCKLQLKTRYLFNARLGAYLSSYIVGTKLLLLTPTRPMHAMFPPAWLYQPRELRLCARLTS